jgi:hypothetical protein
MAAGAVKGRIDLNLLVVFDGVRRERKSRRQRSGECSLVGSVVSRHLGGSLGGPPGAAPRLRDLDRPGRSGRA